jgi:CubicO group peptidase (beta-lactamase class C family)
MYLLLALTLLAVIEISAAIIRNATGRSVAEILKERVFNPLGFSHTEWRTEGKETMVADINDPNN